MRVINSFYDKEIALWILSNEYLHATNVCWMIPNKTPENLKKLFQTILCEAKAKNGAFISDHENGVLLMYKQISRKFVLKNTLRKLYVLFFVTGIHRGLKALKWQRQVSKIRPKQGWVGMALAIQNDDNKMKTAFEFKQEIINMSENSNLPIYAETTVPRIKKLYESIGFEVYHEMKHGYADLTVWFLKR